jgi:hypothetical protein
MRMSLTDDELSAVETLSDAEIGARVRDSVKRYRLASKDSLPGNVGEAKEIEAPPDEPTAQDDPPHTPGTPRVPERPGTALAAHDRALSIRHAMDSIMPGYSRLGGGRDTNVVDDDLIVQSKRNW